MSSGRLDPALTTRTDFLRGDASVAAGLPSATLHEAAGRIGALPSAIKPVDPAMRVCAPAITVQSPGGDNLWIHRAIYQAAPGDVLVVDVSGVFEFGYWGEIMSTAAQVRGLGGLVINGGVRDGDLLTQIGFPVFSRPLCIRGTGKDFGARGFIGHPVMIGEVIVQPGDLIVGDGDGVVAIPREQTTSVAEAGRLREMKEAGVLERLRAGESTLDIFGLA